MLIRAGIVVVDPMTIILQGCIRVEGDRVINIAANLTPKQDEEVLDLREHALFPGLINAHVHLDLSAVVPPIPEQEHFTDWVRHIMPARKKNSDAMLKESLQRVVRKELFASGTTCVGDYIGDLRFTPHLIDSPLKGVGFLENFGTNAEAWCEGREQKEAHLEALNYDRERWHFHITPHASYSLSADAHAAACAEQRAEQSLHALHIAESADEQELFAHNCGPLKDFIAGFGLQHELPAETPFRYLAQHDALPEKSCMIHCNYLTAADIDLLKVQQATVVHCPPSHAHFGHAAFPLEQLQAANVPIALGTDSLASCESLNLLDALRQCRAAHPSVNTSELLTMVTTNAAQALRLTGRCGSLAPGHYADLCGVRMQATHNDPIEYLLQAKRVDWLMVDGNEIQL